MSTFTRYAASIVMIGLLACAAAGAAPKIFLANDYGTKGDGRSLDTAAIQKAIDAAAITGGVVTLKPGTYLTGSLFLKSGITLEVPEGVTLIGSESLNDYPMLPTRIAGIEMTWPAALINVRDQQNVTITGHGTIDGDGPIWWKSYWDLRAIYEPKGLRWAADYDARRPRLILFQNSSRIHLGGGILLKRSGFWTVQVLYSHDVHIDGVTIRNNEGGKGPSTDGIDIDSSRKVLVEHADIDVNDDALCLKAGRDADGLRVHRATEDVTIRDSIVRRGAAAITITRAAKRIRQNFSVGEPAMEFALDLLMGFVAALAPRVHAGILRERQIAAKHNAQDRYGRAEYLHGSFCIGAIYRRCFLNTR